MLKKSVVTSVAFALSVIGAFTLAHAAPVTPKQDSENCYLIGTADELEGFAAKVNGGNTFTGCAKLTADIHYLGNARLLNSSRDGLQKDSLGFDIIPQRQWTPLQNFAGKIDGQNHTIYGLYAKGNDGVGFIRNTSGATAAVKNLHIADSYFYANTATGCSGNGQGNKRCPMVAGGFVAYTGDNSTLNLERCGFSGAISGGHDQNGGLIGAIGRSATLNLTNSYNEGNINGSGLIGTAVQAGVVHVENCYSTGTYASTAYPLMGKPAVSGGVPTINGSNLGCNDAAEKCNENFNGDIGSVTYVSSDPNSVVANFWNNIYGSDTVKTEDGRDSVVSANAAVLAKIEEMRDKNMSGMSLETDTIVTTHVVGNSTQWDTVLVIVAVLNLNLNLDDEDVTLYMPEDLPVYGVRYNRQFVKNDATSICGGGYNVSTTVLPFTMDVSNIQGGVFYRPKKLYKEDGATSWTVGVETVTGDVVAHTPYIVCPTAGSLTFIGETTVLKTDGPAKVTEFVREPAEPGDSTWKFVGLYSSRKFGGDDDPEAGREYAFSGGKFVRVKSGSSSILRAYLLAPEGSTPSTANPSPRPGLMMAPSAESETSDVRPSQILVKVIGSDQVTFPRVEPVEESVPAEEMTTGVQKILSLPVRKNKDAWYDLNGRGMNKKPTVKGVFLNRDIPAKVK